MWGRCVVDIGWMCGGCAMDVWWMWDRCEVDEWVQVKKVQRHGPKSVSSPFGLSSPVRSFLPFLPVLPFFGPFGHFGAFGLCCLFDLRYRLVLGEIKLVMHA